MRRREGGFNVRIWFKDLLTHVVLKYHHTKTFLYSSLQNTKLRLNQAKSYLLNEGQFIKRLFRALDYLLTGVMIWVAVNWFNTITSYIIIVILMEHYVPWLIQKLKGQ